MDTLIIKTTFKTHRILAIVSTLIFIMGMVHIFILEKGTWQKDGFVVVIAGLGAVYFLFRVINPAAALDFEDQEVKIKDYGTIGYDDLDRVHFEKQYGYKKALYDYVVFYLKNGTSTRYDFKDLHQGLSNRGAISKLLTAHGVSVKDLIN